MKYTVDFVTPDELLKAEEIHLSQYTNGVQNQDYDYYEPAITVACFKTLKQAQEFAFLKTLSGAAPRIFRHLGTDPDDGDDMWEQI